MTLITFAGVLTTLLQNIALFLIGRILTKPVELRKFLGFSVQEEDSNQFAIVTKWVEQIGKIVMIIAFANVAISFVTASSIIENL